LDQAKVNHVVNAFFTSLRTEEDKMLETGLTHNTTVDLLHQATLQLVQEHPQRFEQYIKFFEEACMYLQDDSEELPEVDEIGR
jgi:ClpP class serine protease|tara:strand:- start:286 stop:534 length:249 start_codon:yes stop_codon:yes gene_type:complete